MVCLINRWDDFTFALALLKHAAAMRHKKRQIILGCYMWADHLIPGLIFSRETITRSEVAT